MGAVGRVLGERDFRLLWIAQFASTIGDRLVFVVLALYVTRIGSATDVGLVLAANAVPLTAFLLVGGVWADRLPRQAVIVVSDVVRGALHLTLAVLILSGGVASVWTIVAIEAAFATAQAFFLPAYTGVVPQVVAPELIQGANAATSVAATVAGFIGPALATALVAVAGAGYAFALDAATFFFSAVLVVRVRPRPRGDPPVTATMIMELRDGWEEVRRNAWVWVTVLLTAAVLVTSVAPFYVTGAAVAAHRYGAAGVFGAMAAASGAGTVAGSVLAFRWRPERPIWAALVAVVPWPIAVLLYAAGAPVVLTALVFALAGGGIALYTVWWQTALAERIRPEMLSRVSAYEWIGSVGLLPFGYLLAGPLGQAYTNETVLSVGAALALVALAAGLCLADIRALRADAPAAT